MINYISISANDYGAGTIWILIIILQGFCFVGGVARFIYCMVQVMHDEAEAQTNIKRAKHAVIFIILGISALQIANIITRYFGGPSLTG